VVTHQLQVERRTAKARRPKTDVLPLVHATNVERAVEVKRPVCFRDEREQRAIVVTGELHLRQVVKKEVELREDGLEALVDHSVHQTATSQPHPVSPHYLTLPTFLLLLLHLPWQPSMPIRTDLDRQSGQPGQAGAPPSLK